MKNGSKISHVLLIADGNRRWAADKKISVEEGYKAGALSVEKFIECCIQEKIKYITIWLFSSANWGRPVEEISVVMKLINFYLQEYDLSNKYKIRIHHIGKKEKIKELFPDLYKTILTTEKNSSIYESTHLNLAIDYSITDEIIRIIKKAIERNIQIQDINFESIKQFTDLYGQPNIDLRIRTSGLQRLSGIMPIQTTISECS